MPEHTMVRLQRALEEAGCHELARQARMGRWDDFRSDLERPKSRLIEELHLRGTIKALALAELVMKGEYDNTAEEAKAYMKSHVGKENAASIKAHIYKTDGEH